MLTVRWIIVAAALCVPLAAQAQERVWGVSVGGGPSVPLSLLSDEAKIGQHAMLGVSYRTPIPVTLRLELLYHNFNAVSREPSIHSTLGGEWYRQLSGVLSAKYEFGHDALRPYLLAGLSVAREWHDDRTYWTDVHVNKHLNAGAGVAFPLWGSDVFLESRYLNVAGGRALPTRPPAIHREVDFKSIPVTLGVSF